MNVYLLFAFKLGVIAFGAASTIANKGMDSTTSLDHSFYHPYFQTASMFLGELSCLLAYSIQSLFKESPKQSFSLSVSINSPIPQDLANKLALKLKKKKN